MKYKDLENLSTRNSDVCQTSQNNKNKREEERTTKTSCEFQSCLN